MVRVPLYSIKCLSNVFALVRVLGSCRFIHHHLFSIRFVHAPVLGSTKFSLIYSLMFKTLQLQRFIKCLIITRYDIKFIGICQLIVAEWLVLLAINLKVSGSSLTVTPGVFQGKFGRYIRK
jgi:hypothetical protein